MRPEPATGIIRIMFTLTLPPHPTALNRASSGRNGRLSALVLLASLAMPVFAVTRNPEIVTRDPAPATSAQRPGITSLIGDYFYGDGLRRNYTLRLTGSGRFTYEKAGYEGVEEKVEGNYTTRNGRIILQPTSGSSLNWPSGVTTELVPVPWGERMYLIPSNDLLGFSNAVNRGAEPITGFTDGRFLLREGDCDKRVAGKPQLPEGYAGLILDEPVSGRVLCANQAGLWKMAAGRVEGLRPGMELCARSPDDQLCVVVQVIEVEEHTAVIKALPVASEDEQQSEAPATQLSLTDWTVSSRSR